MKKTKFIIPQDTKQVTISSGGGMGGASKTYSLCHDIKIDGGVIAFKGYRNVPQSQHDHNVAIGMDIMSFNTSCWPPHRIANLRSQLESGNLTEALKEYRATQPDNLPKTIRLEKVTANNNWHLMEP